jgi:hypothetical protein
METATINMIEGWVGVSLPRVSIMEWDPATARKALSEVRRLQGELDAAKTVLVSVLAEETKRDTKAAVVRELGVGSREADRIVRASKVVGRLPEVADRIAVGEFSLDHVQCLLTVEPDDAVELLTFAGGEGPDEFGVRVHDFRVANAGPRVRDQQFEERSVWWFATKHGSVGMRAVFPRLEGTQFQANLEEFADRLYRERFPDRAKINGGHGQGTRSQRMADALIEAVNGEGIVQNAHSTGGDDMHADSRDVVTDGVFDARTRADDTSASGSASDEISADVVYAGGALVRTGRKLSNRQRVRRGEDSKRRGSRSSSGRHRPRGRTAFVVTFDIETLQARALGGSLLEQSEALSLLDQARTDVYFCVKDQRGSPLNLGRDKRFATEVQKLALAIREGGVCSWPGCSVPWTRCDVDHLIEFNPPNPGEPKGRTDLAEMALKCNCGHHSHRHETGENAFRNADGTWTIVKPDTQDAVGSSETSDKAG